MFRKGTIYMKKYITYTRFLIGILMLLHTGITCLSQTPVTRIYTDHSGYFTSSTSSPVSVDVATQNLIAFRTGSTVWSTGVNNAALTANGITFVPLNFNAMPATVSGSSSSAVIGLGRQYGGFSTTPAANGCYPAVTPPFGGNVSSYLTDGQNGLDLSTAVFNIGGTIGYTVSMIDPASIGDGVPDIVVTQTGDLNSSVWDKFRFLNASNVLVGTEVDVNFSAVSAVARPYWKFYTLGGACGASTAGTRDLRLLAFDFADLGITISNYTSIARFQHILTPNSDVAFVAYNTISAVILPITLLSFEAQQENDEVRIRWRTATEINTDYFVIERSADGYNWEQVVRRTAAGNSHAELQYEEFDENPLNDVSYYRLKQTDFDGNYTYSNIVAVNIEGKPVELFPNPVSGILSVRGENVGKIRVLNLLGQDVTGKTMVVNASKTFVQIDVSTLDKGYYIIRSKGRSYPVIVE